MKLINVYALLICLFFIGTSCSNDGNNIDGNDIVGFSHCLEIRKDGINILNEIYPIQESPIVLNRDEVIANILTSNKDEIPTLASILNTDSNNSLKTGCTIVSTTRTVSLTLQSKKIFGDDEKHILDITFKMKNGRYVRENGLIQYESVLFDGKPSSLIGNTEYEDQISIINID